MRLQITAIVNFSPADTDALLQLLAAKAEKLEISTLAGGKKKPGNARGPHNVRYPRNATLTPNFGGYEQRNLRGQQLQAVELLTKAKPGFWPADKRNVRAMLKPLGTSGSSVLTALLDAGLLKVAPSK